MSDVAIRVENLAKQYRIGAAQVRHDTLRDALAAKFRRDGRHGETNTIWALKDVSFEVKRGEVVGVIGRNGAGKSTLLKILSRITEPTSGRAEIHGRVGSLLEVGTGFHPELTGRENIYLNGAILGMKRAEIAAKFDEIVAFAEIEKFLDTPVKRYSSGMYVRLAFAVAAHLEPEILLVDEVLAVGDVGFQKKCLGKMGDVAHEGRTVLFVSHNLPVVRNLCRVTLVFGEGRLANYGSTNALLDEYQRSTGTLGSERTLSRRSQGEPGELEFVAIRVQSPGEAPSQQLALSKGVELELDYEIIEPVAGANVCFQLWNADGVCILTSTDVDSAPESIHDERLPGTYRARCRVSPEFLRPGDYRVDLSASIPRVRWLCETAHALSFTVYDDGSVCSKLNQGRLGAVAPVLPWISEPLEG